MRSEMGRRAAGGAALAALLAPVAAQAALPAVKVGRIGAPDVVAYCDTTLKPALIAAGAAFRRRTGVPVRVFGNLGPQSLRLIAHGARNDVVVTQGQWLDPAAARGLVQAASVVGGWRDATVLAGRTGAPLAGLPSPSALTGLLQGGRLGVIDPTQSGGPDGDGLARRLGWAVPLSGAIDGPGVAFLVRHGRATLGLLPRSAALAAPALAVLAAVPDTAAPPAAYVAAASKNALSANTAAFLDYLRGPEAASVLQRAGLEAA